MRTIVFVLLTLCFSPAVAQDVQHGKASYYAKKWTGRTTANGERLHHDSMTCAHRNYPFGTLLLVTNTINGRQVVVRVTDRGPFARGRVVDLSWGAAKAIGMLSSGVVPVTIERISTSTIPFKPEDDMEVPKIEFDLADLEPAGLLPVWQQDEPRIDHKAVRRDMHKTAKESANASK